MRLDRVWIDGFRNLKDVSVDFDETRLTTVVIGQNGAGKSNLIEAITDVFRYADLNRGEPRYRYEIDYPETRNAFLGGFKRAYIESWNSAIEAQRLGVLTASTSAQKRRRDYLTTHEIEWTKDAKDAMTNYEIKPTRITADKRRRRQ